MQSLFSILDNDYAEDFPNDINHIDPEQLLLLLGDWKDPNPPPLLEDHDGVTVLRDDLLVYGSKIRFIDYLIRTTPAAEWIYGGTHPYGYGGVSLANVCTKYHKKATCFVARRNRPTDEQYLAANCGAKIIQVPNGRLSVCIHAAKEYQKQNEHSRLLPMGLWDPLVIASIIKVARDIPILPEEVWLAGGSCTLSRGLQLAWPQSRFNVVQTGHGLSQYEIARANLYVSPYKFNECIKDYQQPPFPSAPYYDAKVWPFVEKYATKDASTLFWNVA